VFRRESSVRGAVEDQKRDSGLFTALLRRRSTSSSSRRRRRSRAPSTAFPFPPTARRTSVASTPAIYRPGTALKLHSTVANRVKASPPQVHN